MAWTPGILATTGSAKVEVMTNSVGMKLARIPAGKFRMGSPGSEAERESEEVRHEVVITKSFYLGVYEVTQSEYAEVMRDEDEGEEAYHDQEHSRTARRLQTGGAGYRPG